ncbi:MAG: hypothetical protein WC916_04395 [Candidatus Woesearchaeota archaeon]
MGSVEREKFLKTIDNVVKKMSKQNKHTARVSETTHYIMQNGLTVIEVQEAARCIVLKQPYEGLPEKIKNLIEIGKNAGYRFHDYIPK